MTENKPASRKLSTITEFQLSEGMKIIVNTDKFSKCLKIVYDKNNNRAIGIMSSRQDIQNLADSLTELLK